MCLILLANRVHKDYPLVLAANRDEFYERPTLALGEWEGRVPLLAGKDARAGGTWMGIARNGRFAAITNFRDPAAAVVDAPSRGALVIDYLQGDEPPQVYLARVAEGGRRYNGYNLLCGDAGGLWYDSNRKAGGPEPVPPGIHGLSNHLLNTPWPKVQRGTAGMGRIVRDARAPDEEALFRLLSDRTRPPDAALPETGVGTEWERTLSPIFIASEVYGTRSSTLLLWQRSGRIALEERTWLPDGGGGARPGGAVRREFSVDAN